MGRTVRKTDENWERAREERSRKKQKSAKKHEFLNEPKISRKDEDDEYEGRSRRN